MMSLSANLTCELQGVDNLLFSFLDFSEGIPSLKPHLKIEAYDLKNLFVSTVEAHILFVTIKFGFALDDYLNVLIFVHDWEAQEL